jgi:hypothetical protein
MEVDNKFHDITGILDWYFTIIMDLNTLILNSVITEFNKKMNAAIETSANNLLKLNYNLASKNS